MATKRGVRFISKGRGRNRRVIPIYDRRKMPERWRETGVVAAAGRPMNMSEIERRAEILASDSRPVKLIAMRPGRGSKDGRFEVYMRSFTNRPLAESVAYRLKKSGFDVGISTIRHDGNGRLSGISMDVNRGDI